MAVDLTPIDPASVPTRRLRDDREIPAIGLGTFGSDHADAATVAHAVDVAITLGYRHVDAAAVYGNEPEIGQVLRRHRNRGLRRDDLWVSSKLWNDSHAPEAVSRACERTLLDLGLEHLDVYLVHWPFPNHHTPGADVDERHAEARPFQADRFLETWGAMERLIDRGLVRSIGTSNMTIPKLDAVLGAMRHRPVVNQMELHPHHQQPVLFDHLVAADIAPIGFCPIGSPARPERDRTAADTSPTADPVIRQIAEDRGVHPAEICVTWAAQRGQIPIPFSTSPANLRANLAAVCGPPLAPDEMAAIAAIDRDGRLIKGQVFLWRPGQDWRDLWDLDGEIAT